MYLLFTDETNVEPRKNVKFFVYGGLYFPLSTLPDLHHRVADIRGKHGYLPGDTLKFTLNELPDHLAKDTCTSAKNDVLSLCAELECRFMAFVIHHGVMKNKTVTERKQQGANVVIGKFHALMESESTYGMCIIDNIPEKDQYKYLREKATRGLVLHTGGEIPLPRIPLFAATCVDASHAASAIDIVLGAFRYAINHDKSSDVACSLLRKVLPLIPHEEKSDGGWKITEIGMMLRPTEPRLSRDYGKFKPDYDDLMDRINGMLAESPKG